MPLGLRKDNGWRPGRIWNLCDTTLVHGHDHEIFREMTLLLWLNISLLEGFIHRCYWDVFIYSVLVSVLCVRFRVRSSCFLCLASKLFVCFVLVFVSVRFRVYLWLHGCFCDRFCCFGKCLLHFFVLFLLSDHILGRVKKSFCVGMCFIYLVSVSAFGFDFVFVPVVFVFRVDIDCVFLLLTPFGG